jgi:hypothetical protein
MCIRYRFIPFDRESRAIIDSSFEKIRRGVVSSVRWTCRNGYINFTADNISSIEIAGLTQIQAAFDWAEAEIAKLQQA